MFNFVFRATVTSFGWLLETSFCCSCQFQIYVLKVSKIWSILWNTYCIKVWLFAVPFFLFWYFLGICYFFNLPIEKFVSLKCWKFVWSREFWFDLYCYVRFSFRLNVNFCFSIAGGGGGENWDVLLRCSWLLLYCIMYSEFFLYNYKIEC